MNETTTFTESVRIERDIEVAEGDTVIWIFTHEAGATARTGDVTNVSSEDKDLTVIDAESGETDHIRPWAIAQKIE